MQMLCQSTWHVLWNSKISVKLPQNSTKENVNGTPWIQITIAGKWHNLWLCSCLDIGHYVSYLIKHMVLFQKLKKFWPQWCQIVMTINYCKETNWDVIKCKIMLYKFRIVRKSQILNSCG
jgi:hypothetical protein